MKQDKLTELIRDLDEHMPRGTPRRVNVSAIRQRAAQKRRVHRIRSMAALVMGAAVLTVGLLWRPDRSLETQAAATGNFERLHVQTDLLLAQVNMLSEIQHKISARARQHQRVNHLRRQMATIPDPRATVHREVSQAAQTLVAAADRLLQEPGQKRRARKTYERVVQLFPEDNWAHIARKRLLAMKIRPETMKGDLP